MSAVQALGDEVQHAGVNVEPVAAHLGRSGPRQHAAARPLEARSDELVVRVEQVVERRVVGRGVGRVGQDEGLEEPRRVSAVPLCRAHVGHRLDRLVLAAERCGKGLRPGANVAESVGDHAVLHLSLLRRPTGRTPPRPDAPIRSRSPPRSPSCHRPGIGWSRAPAHAATRSLRCMDDTYPLRSTNATVPSGRRPRRVSRRHGPPKGRHVRHTGCCRHRPLPLRLRAHAWIRTF